MQAFFGLFPTCSWFPLPPSPLLPLSHRIVCAKPKFLGGLASKFALWTWRAWLLPPVSFDSASVAETFGAQVSLEGVPSLLLAIVFSSTNPHVFYHGSAINT